MASPSSPSCSSPLLLLPRELVLIIAERCADCTDDPQALLRLSWAGSSIRRELILADDLWQRAFQSLLRRVAAAVATPPQPPPNAGSKAPQWRHHYLDLLRSLCRECGCRPTPYVHALLPGKPRLCSGCEQALPKCRLITALEALEALGVGEQQLGGLPSVVTCGVRMWLASAVEGLAEGGGEASSGEDEESEGDERAPPRRGGTEQDAERRRRGRKAAKRAAKEAQRLRRAQGPGGRGGHEQRQQEQQQQQQQQQRRRQEGRRRSGGANDADKGGARRAAEKQRSGYVAERERLAAEYGQHAFSALVLKSLMED